MSGDQSDNQATQTAAPPRAAQAMETAPVVPSISPQTSTTTPGGIARIPWQIPSILISIVLIAWGLRMGSKPPTPNDFDGALMQVETLLAGGRLEPAAAQIKGVLEPNIKLASRAQQARFHAAVADYLYAALNDKAIHDQTAYKRAAEHYSNAAELGVELSPAQRERWAESLLAAGDLEGTRKQLAELDARISSSRDESSHRDWAAVRKRVFRHLVESSLHNEAVPFDDLMTTLTDYRMASDTSTNDEIWAIARQTELRFAKQGARQAVDALLVEMRRLENRDLSREGAGIGELYTLLGRGYVELGDYPRAQTHLEHAISLFSGPELAHGEALTLLGQIAVSNGELDAALDRFQAVERDFVGTSNYLPALLGRAEVQSMMGAHDASIAAYREACEQLKKPRGEDKAMSLRVAGNLCIRHDAALALRKLDQALEYVELAETLFPAEQTPADVLIRLASTNRQLADDLIANASGAAGGESAAASNDPSRSVDPAIRREANVRYNRAGEYYLRHFNADHASVDPRSNDATASLWLAADCYDQGGRQELAIEYFRKYLDMQPIEDPRRAETIFRLAQAHQAILDYENAIRFYEQIVNDRSRSSYAAESYVPLARCYAAANRVNDAREQLQQVLAGNRLLQPDASDYREALIEMGRLEYREQSYASAIEAFNQFIQRYPDDARLEEVRYLLGDCYRANALAIADRIKQDPGLAPAEVGRLNTLSAEQLQAAEELFAQISDQPIGPAAGKLDQVEQDRIRRASLYRADCAFELRQYEQAIEYYDRVARQYSSHQSSMYALIQIVNSYAALGDAERASAAHHRALVRLKQLPDDAFSAPDALMDRAAWERWLENNPVGPARTAAVNTSS